MARSLNREIHVTHVIHSLGVGGLENGVVNLVRGAHTGFRHTIICLTAGGGLRPRLGDDVGVFVVGKGRGHDPRSFVRLARLLRRRRPDLVHSRNWATFDTVLAARLASVPTVVHGEHGRDATDPEGLNARRNRLRRLCSPLVDRFVAVSEDLRRWLITRVGIAESRVIMIHNGVDPNQFKPGESAATRTRLGVRSEQPVVGTVARLDPVKDQASLIRAFHFVQQTHPAAILLIVGDGPCRSDLEQLTESLCLCDRVRFIGERNDVPGLLRAMDVFVLPSIAEGISNTVLEAMATGLPVVATRVGGNPELVENGVNGTLVPREDPRALAYALQTYLDDPRLRIIHGTASRQRAVDTFGLDTMREAYVDLYRILSARTRRVA